MPDPTAAERLMTGKSWEEFCDTLKSAGKTILAEGSPENPLDRAEGFRYLSRLARAALETFVEHADPLAPVLHRPVHETAKIGADNPGLAYRIASPIIRRLFPSPERAARTALMLATDPKLAAETGGYYRSLRKRERPLAFDAATSDALWRISAELTRVDLQGTRFTGGGP